MDYDFLKQFPKRMQCIGAYALLFRNSIQKGTWKQYGFEEFYEQTNLTFAVLLYIMEQSLKEEACTMDDIGAYIDSLNVSWLKKDISYEDCRALGDFIVNVVLCDEGKPMYFQGFDFEEGRYVPIHIGFVGNKVIYADGDVKRTSYYLTEEGYNLLLSTLEVESNLKLTIQEMVFQLHLEKASYDKAVDDVKSIFNLLRIQFQKMEEAMQRIRRNALQYSVEDYKKLLEGNMAALGETGEKFEGYRKMVQERVKRLTDQDINIKKLNVEDARNLKNLKTIEGYLGRALDEHQRIFLAHFDLKELYTKELEALSQMSLIKRFSFRNELYDRVMEDAERLERLEYFLRPLFRREPEKTYNLNKALEFQRPIRKKAAEDEEETLDEEDTEWLNEQNRLRQQRLRKYKASVRMILNYMHDGGGSLTEWKRTMTKEEQEALIPSLQIFKEILIEFVRMRQIDVAALRKEQRESLQEGLTAQEFQLNLCILELIDENPLLERHRFFHVEKAAEGETVVFEGISDEDGGTKRIRCSNLVLYAE